MIHRILGIDPGIHGGLAIINLHSEEFATPQIVDVVDIPVTGVKAKERVDVSTLLSWLQIHLPQHAYIERAQAMPRQGASSGFKYGRAVGALEAAITCCRIPLTIVEPSMWKKFHRLPGKDKEAARQRVLQLFPAAHALFARKMDHGRAESVLVALYGASLT